MQARDQGQIVALIEHAATPAGAGHKGRERARGARAHQASWTAAAAHRYQKHTTKIGTAVAAKKKKKPRTRKDVLGGAIRTVPVPARELDLDSPNSPLGRDLAPLGLDDLQTPIERDARHGPLAPPPRRVQIAHVRLELQSARLHLRRLRARGLRREHGAQRRECRGRLPQGELASREAQERFRGRWGARRRLRLEGDGVLAVGEGGAEAFERDVGRRAVREVRRFGGDQIWVGSCV